jgi:hypothetical protein
MKWKSAAKMQKINRSFAQAKLEKIPLHVDIWSRQKVETIQSFLARGGKIINLNERKERPMTTEEIAKEEKPTEEPIKKTKVKKERVKKEKKEKPKKNLSAKEVAEMVLGKPETTLEEVLDLIPVYAAALPRRSWIAKFKSIVSLPQFENLK